MRRPPSLETLLRRPDLGVGAALAMLVALAWLQLASYAPASGPMSAGHAAHATSHAWGPAELGFTLLMWLTMSIAMMLPTAAPAILAFADITRANGRSSVAAGPVGAFVGGYLAVWAGFAMLATVAQWMLVGLAYRWPGFHAGGTTVAGGTKKGNSERETRPIPKPVNPNTKLATANIHAPAIQVKLTQGPLRRLPHLH